MRVEPQNSEIRDPLKEAAEMQVGNDQHHRQQQNDGVEIDCAQCFLGAHDAKRHHENGPNDGCSWTVDLQAWKLSQSEDEIAGKENNVGGHDPHIGEKHRVYLGHESSLAIVLSRRILQCSGTHPISTCGEFCKQNLYQFEKYNESIPACLSGLHARSSMLDVLTF